MTFLKNALMCVKNKRKKVKVINHDYLPILMLLYIMRAYLMLFATLSNAVCFYDAFFNRFLQMLFVFMLCLGLLTHSLSISNMILHHAHCF